MYIYQADLWCDDCGARICKDLEEKGQVPEDPDDPYSYDSDHYPKQVPDDDSSDTPCHCASGSTCINAIHLHNGAKIGCFVGGGLTEEGMRYVRESIVDAICYKGGNEAHKIHLLNLAELWHYEYDISLSELLLYCRRQLPDGGTKPLLGEV